MQFPCKIGYMNFMPNLTHPYPCMYIISRANYNKIVVEYQGNNVLLLAKVEPLHVLVGSFVYLVDFMVMEDLAYILVLV
jgi:hypothetical protein